MEISTIELARNCLVIPQIDCARGSLNFSLLCENKAIPKPSKSPLLATQQQITLCTSPNESHFTNLLHRSRRPRGDPQIDPSYDDVEEDQPIDRAHDFEKIVLGGYAVQEIAKNRFIGEEAPAGSLGGFAIGGFTSRHGTFPPNNLWIRVNPTVDHAQDRVHLAHDPRDRSLREKRSSRSRGRPTTDQRSFSMLPDGILASRIDFPRYCDFGYLTWHRQRSKVLRFAVAKFANCNACSWTTDLWTYTHIYMT